MTSLELSTDLAARKSRIPVLSVTPHDAPDAREAAAGSGAVAYLTKPVNDQVHVEYTK